MHSFSNLETNFVKAPYLEALQQLRSLNTQNLRPTLLQYTTQGSSLVQYNILITPKHYIAPCRVTYAG